MHRLLSLDYLRGLAAFGIMIYHYLTCTLGNFTSDSLFGRIGIYGVSIFYVLSGLTLYYVYFDKFSFTGSKLIDFFKKRIYRLFPLLWVVTIIAILISREAPNLLDLFLNLSGLFGFFKWDTYFSTGVWSIGNELVFYTLFPFMLLFVRRFKPLLWLLSALIFGFFLYFAFFKLNPAIPLGDQWRSYVNPLNQAFLFFGGFFIGHYFKKISIKSSVALVMLLVSLGLFVFYPVDGNQVSLVTGLNRLVFTLLCFIICISFYKLNLSFPSFLHKPLKFLGEASYSIYLIHPLVYILTGWIGAHFFEYSETIRLILSVVLTLVISYFVFEYFEKYFMRLGKGGKTLAKSKW